VGIPVLFLTLLLRTKYLQKQYQRQQEWEQQQQQQQQQLEQTKKEKDEVEKENEKVFADDNQSEEDEDARSDESDDDSHSNANQPLVKLDKSQLVNNNSNNLSNASQKDDDSESNNNNNNNNKKVKELTEAKLQQLQWVEWLYEDYRDECWMWAFVNLGQQLIIAFMGAVFPPNSPFLPIAVVSVFLGFILVHELVRPFRSTLENRIFSASYGVVVIVYCCNLISSLVEYAKDRVGVNLLEKNSGEVIKWYGQLLSGGMLLIFLLMLLRPTWKRISRTLWTITMKV
jgi:hypothetical protein